MLPLVLLVLATEPRFPKGLARMELPLPEGLASWSAQSCASCHTAAAAHWRRSGHAAARTNAVFQAALQLDAPAWCVQCHAPLATRADLSVPSADAPAEEQGVTCAACHAGARGVRSTHASPRSPHPIEVDASLAEAALCEGCHQFGFAVRDAHGAIARLSTASAQQDTVAEWRAWSAATRDERTCTTCHMDTHAFGGAGRTDALRAALTVTQRDGALEVATSDVGHPFPTGDIMRWLTLELSATPFFEAPVLAAAWGRTLGLQRWSDGDTYLGVVRDERLPAAGRGTARVPLPPGMRAWRLVLHRVSLEQERAGLLPPEASRVVVTAGLLEGAAP
jgi:hypothetical protein